MRLTRPATLLAGPLAGVIFALAATAASTPPPAAKTAAVREPAPSAGEALADWRGRVDAALRRLAGQLPDELQRGSRRLAAEALRPRGQRLLLGVGSALVLLLMLARRLRGHGDLVVSLNYPDELRGIFSVYLARGRKPRRRPVRRGASTVLSAGRSTRTAHHRVSRETQYRRIRPGRCSIFIEGVLQDPSAPAGEVLREIHDDRIIAIEKNATLRLEVECHPGDCPVDVRVVWDRRPAKEVLVAAPGLPQSLRYARGEPARLLLPAGRHVIAVGSGDRVVERSVEVTSHTPQTVEVDLAGSDTVVFKGCPPAVEPYLHGDISAAARALEREGQARTAHQLLARLHREQGHPARAAEHFEAAGEPVAAAELRAELEDWEPAGELFDAAGDARRAAEMFQRADRPERAGDAYRRAGDSGRAVACYRQAGAISKWIDVLEGRGRLFEAAQVAQEHDERARAVRLLQRVAPDDDDYKAACTLLAETFECEGHREMAAAKLEEFVAAAGTGGAPPEILWRLADLHDQNQEFERALSVLEDLRRHAPTYPNVATRIERLEKRRSERDFERAGSRGGGSAAGFETAGFDASEFAGDDRYEILGEIGRGGMGVVYRARDRRLDRIVALKRLSDSLGRNPRAVRLFLREARASARLMHPNITTLYDADQRDGIFFITMELLEGQPLCRLLEARGRIAARDVARLGIQVAAGLHYAHQQGVIHRDVKTANLFFTADRRVKIMDFGLAVLLEEVLQGTSVIGGTPYYMAPEQSGGFEVDHRADLYAFGVTLFELATGRVPFAGGDIAYQHRHTPPPDPRSLVPELPAALAELILSLLEKDPAARCASASQVGERLQALVRS